MPYLEQTQINKELVCEFFLSFSRFEFALKASGFVEGDENRVNPDWRAFANSIQNHFNREHTAELSSACDLYLYTPPQKQVLINGQLAWSNTMPGVWDDKSVEFLVELLKRVRNNLFHGGKFNGQYHEETARNEALLHGGLLIMGECLRVADNVRNMFEQAAI